MAGIEPVLISFEALDFPAFRKPRVAFRVAYCDAFRVAFGI